MVGKKLISSPDMEKIKHPAIESMPPVVGIGASAGGLEALQDFFLHMPVPNGMAFVVVQHITPTRKGALPQLLSRKTSMTVVEATDQLQVEPNCVYVIPPNKDISILHGKLHLIDFVKPHALTSPIDFFFDSLAHDLQERAIAVILSGMGSDGTLGMGTIKEKAGLALAQSPDSAKFDSMPKSAINAGLVDIVAPVSILPSKIMAYLEYGPRWLRPHTKPAHSLKSQAALEKIEILLRAQTGNDFSLYKRNTLYRRIERRMGLHQIDTISKYARYLRENPHEVELLFKELLIGVTCFFRDTEVWTQLKEKTIPELIARYPEGKKLRVWVPACSTGEEAYTLAIVFKEVMDELKPAAKYSMQIYATDLDHDAIDKARQGLFLSNISTNVTPERLSKFFITESMGYKIHPEIRSMVVFAPQNIITDPPFTKLDILSCRNLLIYFSPTLQQKLISLFHYTLLPNGILILGHSEGINNLTNLFSIIERKIRVYRRAEKPLLVSELSMSSKNFHVSALKEDSKVEKVIVNLQTHAEQLLLKKFAPSAVLVNADGDILYISGRTGKYLEPAAGKANLNIHAMAREGLRFAISSGIKNALLDPQPITIEALKIDSSDDAAIVTLSIHAINHPEALKGTVLIVFTDVVVVEKSSSGDAKSNAIGPTKMLLAELESAREQIQILYEEMQSSQEEVRASNEELQSSNEELQSTNEELATSREEMQSLNLELMTLNTELQSKVENLSWVNNDLNNLLHSTDIATIFLDNAMNIRRFTRFATQLFKLIPSDEGRPLSDIVTELDYPDMISDAMTVLSTLSTMEKIVSTLDSRWFKVKIMPYRTQDNMINGVMINMIEVTETRKLEEELHSLKK